jgi:hypothetical protein
MVSSERVKPRLFQALIKSAHPDLNSRPTVQISNLLLSHYTCWEHKKYIFYTKNAHGGIPY